MTKLLPWHELMINLFVLNPNMLHYDPSLAKMIIPVEYDASDNAPIGLLLGVEDYDKAHGNYPIRPMLPDYCANCGTHYGQVPNGRLLVNCPHCKDSPILNTTARRLDMLHRDLGITQIMLAWLALNLLNEQLDGGYDANQD